MRKLIRYLMVIIGTLIIINLLVVPFYEPSLIYFPTKKIMQTPKALGLSYENVYLTLKNGIKINGWFVGNQASEKVI